MTTEDLFEGLKNKKNEAFEELYLRSYRIIETMVLKNSGNIEDVSDVIQDGMVAVWLNIQKGRYAYDSKTKVSTYFYSVCYNIWMNKLRKLKKMSTVQLTPLEISDDVRDTTIPHRELMLEMCFKKLGAKCQKMLQFYYYEKLSLKEIAHRMDYTEKTVKNNKYRCMQRLKSHFNQLTG